MYEHSVLALIAVVHWLRHSGETPRNVCRLGGNRREELRGCPPLANKLLQHVAAISDRKPVK